MKRIALITFTVLFLSTSVFAVDFAPTLLKLSAPEMIAYEFDGSEMEFDVTTSGRSAKAIFMIYTKDQADAIGMVQNGFLGWHYVDKIDTCIYWSQEDLQVGKTTLNWDGKDADGGLAAASDYTYYLWAYDNMNPKEIALRAVAHGETNMIESTDENGNPLANPVMYVNTTKWPLGIDPETPATELETTSFNAEFGGAWNNIVLDPADHSMIYVQHREGWAETMTIRIVKYQWVPNGASLIEEDWAEDGVFLWTTAPGGSGTFGNGLQFDGDNTIFATFCNQYDLEPVSDILYLDMAEGTEIETADLSDWFCSLDDSDAGGQMNGGPSDIRYMNGILYCHGQQSCMILAMDPAREEGERVTWVNGNGDYVSDYHWEETSSTPWVCNDFMVGPYMYSYDVDTNGFSIFPTFDAGAVSFGVIGPDGTGIDYFAFAGETAQWKAGTQYIDLDSPYDGLYTDNNTSGDETSKAGTWFIGQDSVKGTISSGVGVQEAAPAAFTVAQNSPNPFNPTTTISFTPADAGIVSVDVFNVAGQKVDTLVNEFMDAGSHSVVWDASDFSAGVYFYTVKSGDFSRTMKMTLVK